MKLSTIQQKRNAAASLLAKRFCHGRPYSRGHRGSVSMSDDGRYAHLGSCLIHDTSDLGKAFYLYVHFQSPTCNTVERVTLTTIENFDVLGKRIHNGENLNHWPNTNCQDLKFDKPLLDTIQQAIDDPNFPISNFEHIGVLAKVTSKLQYDPFNL